jgi:hypothetical protein
MEENKELSTVLEKYKGRQVNLLLPITHVAGLSEFHALAVSEVTIDTTPEAGEVYLDSADEKEKKPDDRKYRFHKTAYLRISACAGIQWSPSQSGIERLDKDYIAFKSVGYILMPDGQPYPMIGHYDIDFLCEEENLREEYGEKARKYKKEESDKKKQEYIDFCVKRDLRFRRDHKLALVETGAMERVIKGMLALKNFYTGAELKNPFVIARVVFRPDYSNELTRNMAINHGNAAALDIFGPGKAMKDVTPVTQTEQPQAGKKEEEKKPSAEESALLDFQNSDELGQCKSLTNLATQKNYDLADYLKRTGVAKLTDFAKAKREDFFKYLLSLPDKDTNPKTDAPY